MTKSSVSPPWAAAGAKSSSFRFLLEKDNETVVRRRSIGITVPEQLVEIDMKGVNAPLSDQMEAEQRQGRRSSRDNGGESLSMELEPEIVAT